MIESAGCDAGLDWFVGVMDPLLPYRGFMWPRLVKAVKQAPLTSDQSKRPLFCRSKRKPPANGATIALMAKH